MEARQEIESSKNENRNWGSQIRNLRNAIHNKLVKDVELVKKQETLINVLWTGI